MTQKLIYLHVLGILFPFQLLAQSSGIESLTRTEKEFSEYCNLHGGPEAWMKYFAADGIMFAPHPVNAIEFMKPRLGSTRPRVNHLLWEASFSDISSAGDLGYNLGPSVRQNIKYDTVPDKYGFIFSIWRKINDSTWRVALDAGIEAKEKSAWHSLTGRYESPAREPAGSIKDSFLETEEKFYQEVKSNGFLNAYEKYLTAESKMLRNEWGLFLSKSEILKWHLANENGAMRGTAELKMLGSGTSASNDLAYTYGSFQKTSSSVDGYFVHVWKRMNSTWSLIFDVTHIVPK